MENKGEYFIVNTLLGGSIGSYVGMKIFRHKTKHSKFKYGIPFIILVQLCIFLYMVNYNILALYYFMESIEILL